MEGNIPMNVDKGDSQESDGAELEHIGDLEWSPKQVISKNAKKNTLQMQQDKKQ